MQIRQNLRPFWNRAVGHISTLILSLIMATIVWLIAINEVNPLVTQEFPDPVPVEVRGLNESRLQSVQDLSDEYVRLVLRAPRSSWASLRDRDLTAYVDLSNLTEGVHEVPVHVEKRDPNVVVTEIQRGQLRVQLDPVITQTLPIEVAVMDSAEFGYYWQQPTIDPISVTVVGPASQINLVAAAVIPVYLRGARNQVERLEEVQLVNRRNQTVENVQAQPATVEVVVPIERWPGQRVVAVRVKLTGQPAYGYRLGRVTATPSSVVLYGPVDALDQVPGVVETAPLSLDNATDDISTTLDLILPDGVNAAESNSILVFAEILPVEDGKTIQLAPLITNLGEGLTAASAPDMVDVILSGPVNLLSSLGPDDVYVLLDVNGLAVGNHVVQPQVAKPPGIRLEGVLPETVEIVITSSISATVSSTVSSTISSTVTATVTATVPSTTPSTLPWNGTLPPPLPITPTVESSN
ncbi:MAG: CdaR family protein [Caldilineaceae bacterium]